VLAAQRILHRVKCLPDICHTEAHIITLVGSSEHTVPCLDGMVTSTAIVVS
jgi:hypothetical protein